MKMRTIAAFFKFLSRYTKRLGVCGNAGLIVGAIAGGILALLNFLRGGNIALTDAEVLYIGLMLSLFGWLTLLFILGALVRYPISSVAVPTFVNALLVCLLTTYLSNRSGLFEMAWLIGILVGILVGYLLCTIYKRLSSAICCAASTRD
jgi:hypothetical protein